MGIYQGSTNIVTGKEQGNLVTTDEEQIISATKYFTNDPVITLDNPAIVIKATNGNYETSNPDSDVNMGNTIIQDSDGKWLGCFEAYAKSNGYTEIRMNAQKNGVWAKMPLGLLNNGSTSYAYAPSSSRINSIVTTKMVSISSENWYYKLGNGLILQGGYCNNSTATITFPTPFTGSITYNVSILWVGENQTGLTPDTPTDSSLRTNTKCTIWAGKSGSVASSFSATDYPFKWMAIGY